MRGTRHFALAAAIAGIGWVGVASCGSDNENAAPPGEDAAADTLPDDSATTNEGGIPGVDPGFGEGGATTIAIGANPVSANGAVLQSDGKVVVFGSDFRANESFYVFLARFDTNGALDPTFGAGGKAVLGLSQDMVGTAISIAPDQKLLIATKRASVVNDDASFVARVDSSGLLDPTWGASGIVRIEDADVAAIAVQTDGKVLIGANGGRILRRLANGASDPAFGPTGERSVGFDVVALQASASGKILAGGGSSVTRLAADGTPDTTFDGEGVVTLSGGGVRGVAFLAGDAVIAGGASSIARYGATGALDNTFDGDGVANTGAVLALAPRADGSVVYATGSAVMRLTAGGVADNTFATVSASGTAAVLVVDTRVVTVGTAASQTAINVTRHSDVGVADPTFATNGLASFNPNASRDVVISLARQSTGAVVAAAYSNATGLSSAIVRLSPNGAPDTTFAGTGRITQTTGFYRNVLVDSMDRILATDIRTPLRMRVARFAADGTRDLSFGNTDAGVAEHTIGVTQTAAYALALDANGRIIVAGQDTAGFLVTRLTTNGALDTTFGSGGFTAVSTGTQASPGAAIAIQPDQKIVVAGTMPITGAGGTARDGMIARLDANGAIDNTFGTNGIVRRVMSGDQSFRSIFVQQDGAIFVGGFGEMFRHESILVAKYTAAGAPDTTFAGSGAVIEDVPTEQPVIGLLGSQPFEGPALAVAPSGFVYSGGLAVVDGKEQMVVFRYLPNGTRDPLWGTQGMRVVPTGRGYDAVRALLVQPDGKLVVGGRTFTPSGGSDLAFLRFVP